jgi:hypothetical protein
VRAHNAYLLERIGLCASPHRSEARCVFRRAIAVPREIQVGCSGILERVPSLAHQSSRSAAVFPFMENTGLCADPHRSEARCEFRRAIVVSQETRVGRSGFSERDTGIAYQSSRSAAVFPFMENTGLCADMPTLSKTNSTKLNIFPGRAVKLACFARSAFNPQFRKQDGVNAVGLLVWVPGVDQVVREVPVVGEGDVLDLFGGLFAPEFFEGGGAGSVDGDVAGVGEEDDVGCGGGRVAGFVEDFGAEADDLGHGAGGEAGVGVGAAFEVAALAGVPPDEGIWQDREDISRRDGEPIGEETDPEEGRQDDDAVDVGAVLRDPRGGDASGREADDGNVFPEGVSGEQSGTGVVFHRGGCEVSLGHGHAVAVAVIAKAGNHDIRSGLIDQIAEFAELGRAVAQTVEEDVDVLGLMTMSEDDAAGSGVDERGVFAAVGPLAAHDGGAGVRGEYDEKKREEDREREGFICGRAGFSARGPTFWGVSSGSASLSRSCDRVGVHWGLLRLGGRCYFARAMIHSNNSARRGVSHRGT